MKWEDKDDNDSRVDGYSVWAPINTYRHFWAEKFGVYIFADDGHDVKYIWNAGAPGMRDGIADGIQLRKDRGATHAKALYTRSFEDAESLMDDLIAKYNPPNN